jgi:hypothetical protein
MKTERIIPAGGKSSATLPNGAVVDKVTRYGWSLKDRPGELCYLNKDDLRIDHSYQRPERTADHIYQQWSWMSCGALTVALRESTYWVVDGQRRLSAALRRSDIVELPCVVFVADDLQSEASAFLGINEKRAPIRSIEKHKAALVTGEPAYLIVEELARLSGRVVASNSGPGTLACVKRLVVYATANEARLRAIWPLATDLCRGEVMNHVIVSGLWWVESRLSEGMSLTDTDLRRRFMEVGYHELVNAALQSVKLQGKSGERVWGNGFVAAINRKRRNRLESDPSTGRLVMSRRGVL